MQPVTVVLRCPYCNCPVVHAAEASVEPLKALDITLVCPRRNCAAEVKPAMFWVKVSVS